MEQEKHLEKIQSKKLNIKTVKIKVKLTHVNKEPLANFCAKPFSESTLNIELKISALQNYLFFWSSSDFGVTKILTSI